MASYPQVGRCYKIGYTIREKEFKASWLQRIISREGIGIYLYEEIHVSTGSNRKSTTTYDYISHMERNYSIEEIGLVEYARYKELS